MARDTLTGSRIRERRLILGMRQAELAREAGISASYLNLIEHNRRRIGGKLLVGLAGVLGVEPSMLSEGAEAALISTLREAAADSGVPVAELDRVDEFAGRFPGWAEVLAAGHRRIASLERTVETLSDRLTHDPSLAASVHEVLSTAAAIRSTASILAETGELEPEWRDRFHKNLNQDSLRLSESSRELVNFLDDGDTGADRRGMPQEEAEAFLQDHGYHFPELEEGTAEPADLLAGAPALASEASRSLALSALESYAEDARLMPLPEMERQLAMHGLEPVELSRHFGCPLPAVLRRIAALPEDLAGQETGLVICDSSGALVFRKPLTGFAMPRFGASCPLWPLYTALLRPYVPVRRSVMQQGRTAAVFDCMAVAGPQGVPDFGSDPLYRSAMLILPGADVSDDPQPVGSSCRVCPRRQCPARREPSILKEEF
ncbi:short-chain fatty acyl-CoA regulator family protein [Leisingera sp. S132]|uniref:helix-turn-helix domain-containing protein n=1 Tax=Leisingera sp. S132 TaxID=2867016 RepID=UPI0021A498D8|nr:XRE family transcriptional regulator [Leisingera sp. S132]UWQ77669.1 short-chain fatty acyl-CoA regulator family protein [Leisingera sp. S132]